MKTQKEMYYQTIQDRILITEQFFEVQSSENPLTIPEIEAMIAKHPEKYGHLVAFIKE